MARKVIRVNLELDRIHCYDEGDGWGNAEPYLWTVFFKVDGNTVQLTESLTLSGPPTTHNTPGSHGNLGDTDVDAGDNVTIPAVIGEWETYLKPIPAPESLSGLLKDVGGVVGVVAILMEEDNVSDDGAEAGHAALNSAVRNVLQQIIDTRNLSNQDVSEEEIKGFTGAIEGKIKDAIVSQQNFFENFWSWINSDDTIGVKVFIFKHDDLDPAVTQNFSHRWNNEGDWEIFGHITSTPLCPADALSKLLAGIGKSDASAASASAASSAKPEEKRLEQPADFDLQPMRTFRDGTYRTMPGLARWFALAKRHAGRIVGLALKDQALFPSARKMLEWGNLIAQQPDADLSQEHVQHAERLLAALSKHRNHHARIDARRSLSILNAIKSKTNREAMEFLASMVPARHPTVAGNPCARVLPRSKSGELVSSQKREC